MSNELVAVMASAAIGLINLGVTLALYIRLSDRIDSLYDSIGKIRELELKIK
jgi:hypothetical protein